MKKIKYLILSCVLLTATSSLFAQEKNKTQEPVYQAPELTATQKAELQKLADERTKNSQATPATKPAVSQRDSKTVRQPANKPSSSVPAAGTQKASGTPAKPVEKSSIDEPTKKE